MSVRERLRAAALHAFFGWGLAALALALGWFGYGWRGLVFAASLIAFWLLLQFSQALRVMRRAATRPVACTDSAVMLQARVQRGWSLLQIVALTRSLGEAVSAEPPVWRWRDAGGETLLVELRAGRVVSSSLQRAPAAGDHAHAQQAGEQQRGAGGLGHGRGGREE